MQAMSGVLGAMGGEGRGGGLRAWGLDLGSGGQGCLSICLPGSLGWLGTGLGLWCRE